MTEELAQLTYVPIVRRPFAHAHGPFVIGGMGGSGLAGATASYLLPRTHVVIHRNYDLPQFTPENALYIAVSYSGNTEETVGFANHVLKQGKKLAVVSSGGKLADIAERYELPYVGVPEGLVPRMALMYMVRAVLAVMGADRALEEIAAVKPNIEGLVEEADEDAHFMLPAVPLIYASTRNFCLAELGKMCLNESARMPAFANQFPELNHNEMQSFDADMPQGLAHTFRFLMIKDDEDNERVTRRMDVFADLMKDRGRSVRFMDISQKNRSEALVEVWLRFITSARLLGETRGIDPDTQPLVDEFKRLL